MFFHYFLLYCLKIVTLLYLKNQLETRGEITMNDIGMSVGMNTILYYVSTVLSGLSTEDTFNTVYFLDLMTTAIILGMYIKYIERKNEQNEMEHFELIDAADNEACKLNYERNMNILTKPSTPTIEYPNKQIIYIICLCPYFVVY